MGSRLIRTLLAVALATSLACTGCDLLANPKPSGKPQETVGVDPSGEHIDTSTVMPADNQQPALTEPPTMAEVPLPPTQPAQPAQPQSKPTVPQSVTPNTGSGPSPSALPHTGGSSGGGVTHHRRAQGGSSGGTGQ